jgi:putative SOS response-associated peptidase YedK
MCERYVLPDQSAAEREFLPAAAWWKFAAKFNVAAPQFVPVIRTHDKQTEGVMMRWGLIPEWAEGKSIAERTERVPAAGMEASNIYRMPWLSSQRCILPLAGYYLWRLTPQKYRQPYFVRLNTRSVFGVAALWDRSVSESDDVTESCAMIGVPANDLVAGIGDADFGMPAILRRKDYQKWLLGTPVQAKTALLPYKSNWMRAYPVSPRINSTAVDDADLILEAS